MAALFSRWDAVNKSTGCFSSSACSACAAPSPPLASSPSSPLRRCAGGRRFTRSPSTALASSTTASSTTPPTSASSLTFAMPAPAPPRVASVLTVKGFYPVFGGGGFAAITVQVSRHRLQGMGRRLGPTVFKRKRPARLYIPLCWPVVAAAEMAVGTTMPGVLSLSSLAHLSPSFVSTKPIPSPASKALSFHGIMAKPAAHAIPVKLATGKVDEDDLSRRLAELKANHGNCVMSRRRMAA